jgi:hypothetical protein
LPVDTNPINFHEEEICMKTARNRSGIAMAIVAVFLLLACSADALAALNAVGPTSPDNGFPMWYRDRPVRNPASLTLEPCLDANGLCLFDPAVDLPVPGAPLLFPTNFPEELFYWTGDARIRFPGGGGSRALLIMALEGAFGTGPVTPGDQVVFGRIRIRIDTPVAGTYVVTHPYGVETFPDVPAGRRAINMTRDIGIGAPGNFTGALTSDIGPFLTWAPLTAAPAGYVGDPAIEHIVTGSPNLTNYFEIAGPPGSNLGGPGIDVVRTDLFTISGKLATRFGVTVDRATYTRDAAGATMVEVFASSAPGQTIDVTATDFGVVAPVPMLEDPSPAGTGDYYARFGPLNIATDLVPGIAVTNREVNVVDAADTEVASDVVDVVTVAAAQYQVTDALTGAGNLLVTAASSDVLTAFPAVLSVRKPVQIPFPTITSALFNTPVTFVGFAFPAPRLVVRSSKGGVYNETLPIADAPVIP